ncbi:MAG TPA: hypothetical protein VE978_19050 [Chitinophagales bacterium]|nr:hypothetical protein [Chitinophagales bacterium]
MKIFGWIVLINLMIYLGYMIIMNFIKNDIMAAAFIFFHSCALIAISSMFPADENPNEVKQGLLVSGLIILLVGMPVCFFWGASNSWG